MGKKKKEKLRRTMIGGQALMEGVMMRGATSMAMAVRAPDGTVAIETSRLKGKRWYSRVPVLRGVVSFVSSLVSGMSTLMRSAEISTPDEDTPGKGWMALSVILGVLLAVGLFIVLPSVISMLIFEKAFSLASYVSAKTAILIDALFEGFLRILIFVIYLLIMSRIKDIRRTFMYHGAEHRTINCYEHGYEMTVENVQKCSTRHNRCGTTFLFFVMVVSILVFSLASWGLSYFSWGSRWYVKLGVRLALLPIVAGLSYELLRGLAKLPDNKFTNILRAPGLALQRLTTYPPDDSMAEVALKSFLAVLKMDADPSVAAVKFYEHNVKEVKSELREALSDYGLDGREAESETDWILCYAADVKRNELNGMRNFTQKQYAKAIEALKRRLSGMPLDYVIGSSEFFGNRLTVNGGVLIPRMETEVLTEEAIKAIGEASVRVLDLCTGSGCIALALSKATNAQIVACDISDEALAVAQENLSGSGVTVVKSDLFDSVEGTFDIIVSNPPYISLADKSALAPEVLCQPHIALFGGEDGLDFYRRIAAGYKSKLNGGGKLLLEIGYNQAEAVKEIFGGSVKIIKDLDGNDRVAEITAD